MNSPLETREIRLRGLLTLVPGASMGHEKGEGFARADPADPPGCGRAGAWDAAHRRAAESAQADFVTS
jgi:hypothetical protein